MWGWGGVGWPVGWPVGWGGCVGYHAGMCGLWLISSSPPEKDSTSVISSGWFRSDDFGMCGLCIDTEPEPEMRFCELLPSGGGWG